MMKIAEIRKMAFVVGLMLCSGCASVLLTDRMPDEMDRGYVEFVCLNNAGYLLPITQLVGGKEEHVGNTGTFIANKRRRVACKPGINTFFVKPMSCVKRIDAVVSNGMVTVVELTYRKVPRPRNTSGSHSIYIANTTASHLTLDSVVNRPVPINEHDEQLRTNPRHSTSDATESVSGGYMDSVYLASQNTKVGYVEFFNESGGRARALHAEIRYCDPNGVVSVRSAHKGGLLRSGVFFSDARNIFVCPVGTNQFLLSTPRNPTRGYVPVSVLVQEDMVTKVALTFTIQSRLMSDVVDGFWNGTGHGASEPDATIVAAPGAPMMGTNQLGELTGEYGY